MNIFNWPQYGVWNNILFQLERCWSELLEKIFFFLLFLENYYDFGEQLLMQMKHMVCDPATQVFKSLNISPLGQALPKNYATSCAAVDTQYILCQHQINMLTSLSYPTNRWYQQKDHSLL